MDLEAIERKDLATTIAERLREYILSGPFRPGDKLPPEREMAQVLKVTRTTLREALKILQTLKLVAVRQGDGVRVRDYLRVANLEILADLLFRNNSLDKGLLANILEARLLFGKVLARLAAQRATRDQIAAYAKLVKELRGAGDDPARVQEADLACFDALAEASGNMVFLFVLNSIRPIYLRYRDTFADLYGDTGAVVRAHEDLLDALRARDPDSAEKAVVAWMGGGGLDGIRSKKRHVKED